MSSYNYPINDVRAYLDALRLIIEKDPDGAHIHGLNLITDRSALASDITTNYEDIHSPFDSTRLLGKLTQRGWDHACNVEGILNPMTFIEDYAGETLRIAEEFLEAMTTSQNCSEVMSPLCTTA